MGPRFSTLDKHLVAIEVALGALPKRSAYASTLERLRSDLAAARFHLSRSDGPPIVAILGGTGTGKSTLLNRLLQTNVTAASVRRTFTAGPIAVVGNPPLLPSEWLGTEHVSIDQTQLPARGQAQQLAVVVHPHEVTQKIVLIDTPDLDGDEPTHHAQADRVFRWTDAVVFVVTPEKYQMTELVAYYRLAKRYGIQRLHVMNKAQEQAVVDDYARQVGSESIFVIPRDDAGYEPPGQMNLNALRSAVGSITVHDHAEGNAARVADLIDRLHDQVIEPMQNDRRSADRLIKMLRGMQATAPGVDVNPITQQLQRRLQQRSVLFLMGPGQVLQRVRQVPGILARLPRTTWDLLRGARLGGNGRDEPPADTDRPDFRSVITDHFRLVQSRIDDALRSDSACNRWIEAGESEYAATRLDIELAGKIADDQIAQLQAWLQQHWNATPRDTAMIEKLLKVLPGGKKLARWSEAAPYLLAIVVAAHHAFFGPVDLMILGSYSLATWITERLNDQVAARTRAANNAIASEFTDLVRRQIERSCAWVNEQVATKDQILKLATLAEQIEENAPAGKVTA